MKNNPSYPILFWISFLLPFNSSGQTFSDLSGPMGTARSILQGPDGALYVGSSSKGVFKSVDNGQHWSGLGGNTIMTGRINDLAFDTSGHLIAATEQGGIKSWNGTAWASVNNGLFSACGIPIPIRTLAIAPNGDWYAGAHGFSACFPNGDLYRFDGTTWNSIAAGLGNTFVNALAFHPLNGSLYAATDGGIFKYDGTGWTDLSAGLSNTVVHKILFADNGDLFAGTDAGLAKLSSNAPGWTNLNNGLNGEPVYAIALDEDPAHLLIGTGYNLEQAGSLYGALFETLDGGAHWAQKAPGLQTTVINDLAFVGNQGCLAVGWGIFHSTDNGQNWAAANNGFTAKTFNTQGRLAISPAPNHALFYGSDDGVFRSTDDGLSWAMASQGLERHMVTLLKADHFGNLFCGVMRYLGENAIGFGDGLLYKSTDQGAHWLPVAISKDWRYMEISEWGNGALICAHGFGAQPPSATITGSSLALSVDHGEHWTDLDVQSGMAFCCAANATGDLFVAGESQSVYRSTDGGGSFELIVAPGQAGNVGSLEISPTGDILMGSGGQRTLYYSTDNGTSYGAFNSLVLPDYRGVSDIIFDDQGKAYCTTAGQGGSPSLFSISPPFTTDAVFTPIAGLAGSLFKMTWDECGYLYIYRGGGILKSTQALRLPEDACLPTAANVLENKASFTSYPNPVSQVLHLHSDRPGQNSAEIWHLNGQKVAEKRWTNDLDWDLEALPPGLFMLKIQDANGLAYHRKLLKG